MLPTELGRRTIRGYERPPHVRQYDHWAAALATRPDVQRLCVAGPVRHGKSMFWSLLFPAWWMIRNPTHRIFICSYSSDWSHEASGALRDLITELAPYTGLAVDTRYRSRDHWINTAGGQVFATGAPGGSFSGKGADLIVADDLVKDMRQVSSALQRQRLEVYVRSELLSRLEPQGRIVCVLARRHPEDILSFLLAQNAELPPDRQWHFLSHSALTYGEDGTPTALWPQRFDVAALAQIEREHALTDQSWIWDCLYQQQPCGDPASRDFPDSYFIDLFHAGLPEGLPIRHTILSIDPSKGATAKSGDYSAFVLVRYARDGSKWVESELRRMPVSQIIDTAVAYLRKGGIDALSVETSGFQEMVLEAIVTRCRAEGIYCPGHAYAPIENKLVRMRMVLGPQLSQRVLRFADTFHNRLLISQLKALPSGMHDDGPDSLAQNILLSQQLTRAA